MKKNKMKLRLHRETLHGLSGHTLRRAAGGAPSDGPTDCVMNDDTTTDGTNTTIWTAPQYCGNPSWFCVSQLHTFCANCG